MITLFIDTTNEINYFAISKTNKETDIIFHNNKTKKLSTTAMLIIKNLLDKNEKKPKDLEQIIVVNGPGSFTGIRIGVTIAKTMAWTLSIPIKTITSLEVLSYMSKRKIITTTINDRNGYKYIGKYNKKRKESVEVYSKEKVRGREINLNKFSEEKYTKKIIEVIPKIIQELTKKEGLNPHHINPLYLKDTEAEKKLKGEKDE